MLWEYTYDAENRLVQIDRDGLMVNRYIYDGDGNRVVSLGADNKGTIFIGKYFEAAYPHYSIPDPPPPVTEGEGEPNTVNLLPQGDITYYYAGSQRIAMRDANGVYFILSDHLGSSSVVIDESGQIVETGYYLPWGGQRGDEGIATTDYGYTGQMREGDIYYYGARWYDPAIGRFMQADTIVPADIQGTQAFDRYAYVNNNPLRYTDPSGNYFRECGDDHYERCGTIPPPPPTYNVFVCGVYDGNNCGGTDPSTPLYPYYSWPGENAYFDVDYFQNKANTSTAIEEYILRLPKTAKLRFIGHSAGADTIILELNRLRESQSLSRVLGTVILDPTLTASPYFLKTGDLSGILTDIILTNTPIFIGTTVYMEETYSINLYIPATNHGGADNYYYENTIELSHQDLALSVEIANKAWKILRGE